MWRWDQGRLLYFNFDTLCKIAKSLIRFNNVDITECESLFRAILTAETNMPFLPEHYTIKRNYSRVFQCSFLANFIGNNLIVTDFCRNLANQNGNFKNPDDYFFQYISKFRFPFPAFDNYNTQEKRVYPFCAIIKFLMARQEMNVESVISINDVFNYIIANNCTGLENLTYYKNLLPKNYTFTETERRQLREMLIFISQLSILKIYGGNLYLETISDDVKEKILSMYLNPKIRVPKQDKLEEFFEMTSLDKNVVTTSFEIFPSFPSDIEFIEGNKKRVEHFRVERSGLLRKYYKQCNPEPVCDACKINMNIRYPWTDYILDIHHLLPLSSAVAISSSGTSLADIVGLCPSCHRAVHAYYRKWLKENFQNDFKSKQEAKDVYFQAVKGIVI